MCFRVTRDRAATIHANMADSDTPPRRHSVSLFGLAIIQARDSMSRPLFIYLAKERRLRRGAGLGSPRADGAERASVVCWIGQGLR